MSTSRRSFIKGLAGVIAAAPVIAQAVAAPKPAKATRLMPGCYIDGMPCTGEQWWDYDNFPHKHERLMITKPVSLNDLDRRKFRVHAGGFTATYVRPKTLPINT